MPIFQWSEELSVGIREIDEQHKRLIELINTLHDAMLGKKGKESLAKILNDLAEYTVYHFSTEEKYMEKFKYIGYFSHKREHDSFVNKVESFQKDYNANKVGMSIEIMNFLRDWVTNHIKGTDKEYTANFQKNGLS